MSVAVSAPEPVRRAGFTAFAIGARAVPTAQGFLLYAGQWMLLDPCNSCRIVNLLIVVVLLFYTVRIPGMMSRWAASGGRQSNVLGMIARVVVVQQITRTLPDGGRLVRGR